MPAEHLHELSKLHLMAHWLLDTWQAAVMLAGIFFSWSIWYLRNMFVTQKVMKEFIDKNRAEHVEIKDDVHSIKEDVSWMKGFLERNYGDNDDF
jgi:hypothetical protein